MKAQETELIQYLGFISARLTSIDNIESLVKEVSKIIDELVEVQYTAIYLWNSNSNKLELLEAKGFSEEDRKNAEKSVMKRHPGWVFKNKQTLHIPDTRLDNGNISKTGKRSFEVRSRLFVPILNQDKCMGTIGFASGKPDIFDEQHINVIKFIANLSGTIYSNILLQISEKEYQEELEKALNASERAKKLQESFFAKMSHELRTPLNAIIGMSELLTQTLIDSQQSKYLNAINTSSNVLLKLINDILDLSKLQSDKFTLETIPFSIKEILENTIDTFKIKSNDKVKICYKVDSEIPTVLGDPFRLQQVITNLVQNALKFTQEGKVEIIVSLITIENNISKIKFRVKDTGIGIKKEKLGTIFDTFKQENKNTARNYGGSGLGLTISQEIINLYNSSIKVKSKEGIGTEFYFSLHYKISESKTKKILETIKTYDLNNLKVLIVEDNKINQLYAESMLKIEGCNLTIANNGREAITLLKDKNSFDIILMDMQMPIMNGIDATIEIRTKLKLKTSIIGLSANTIKSDIDHCSEAGMNNYLSKPYLPSQLVEKIGETLNLEELYKDENEAIVRPNFSMNLEGLKNKCGNNSKVVIKLITLFINETSKDIATIEDNLKNNDLKSASSLAHKIKPNYQILGITKGYELAKLIEKENNINLIKSSFDELKSITEICIIQLQKELKKL